MTDHIPTRGRYVGGCRCDDCTEANRVYHNPRRQTETHVTIAERPDPLSMIGRPDWMRHAACRGLSPEQVDRYLFPERGQSVAHGKALCATCTVRIPCLEYGLERSGGIGIWGGLSAQERKKLKAERAA